MRRAEPQSRSSRTLTELVASAEGPPLGPPVDVELPAAVVADHVRRRRLGERRARRHHEEADDQERRGGEGAAACTASSLSHHHTLGRSELACT